MDAKAKTGPGPGPGPAPGPGPGPGPGLGLGLGLGPGPGPGPDDIQSMDQGTDGGAAIERKLPIKIEIKRLDIISINCFILFSALNYCDSMHDFMNTKREGTKSKPRETRHYYMVSSAAFFVMIQRIDWYIKKIFDGRLEFEPDDNPFVDYEADRDYPRGPNINRPPGYIIRMLYELLLFHYKWDIERYEMIDLLYVLSLWFSFPLNYYLEKIDNKTPILKYKTRKGLTNITCENWKAYRDLPKEFFKSSQK